MSAPRASWHRLGRTLRFSLPVALVVLVPVGTLTASADPAPTSEVSTPPAQNLSPGSSDDHAEDHGPPSREEASPAPSESPGPSGFLAVQKVTTDGADQGLWTFDISRDEVHLGQVTDTANDDVATTFETPLPPGTYTVRETDVPDGWALQAVGGDDEIADDDACTVTIAEDAAGDRATCTFTNELLVVETTTSTTTPDTFTPQDEEEPEVLGIVFVNPNQVAAPTATEASLPATGVDASGLGLVSVALLTVGGLLTYVSHRRRNQLQARAIQERSAGRTRR